MAIHSSKVGSNAAGSVLRVTQVAVAAFAVAAAVTVVLAESGHVDYPFHKSEEQRELKFRMFDEATSGHMAGHGVNHAGTQREGGVTTAFGEDNLAINGVRADKVQRRVSSLP